MSSPTDPPIRLPDSIRLANRPHVGFDFGTHSTKVIIRERGNANGVVPVLDDACENYPLFASPSVVHFDGERLWFGARAFKSAPPSPLAGC